MNRVKTKDVHFVQDYEKQTLFSFFLFSFFSFFWISFFYFLDFSFFYFFGFFLFFFTTSRRCPYLHRTRTFLPSPHEGILIFTARGRPYLRHMRVSLPFFTHRCLLDWAYDPNCQKQVSSFFFSHIGAYLIGLTIHKLPKEGLTLFHTQVPT